MIYWILKKSNYTISRIQSNKKVRKKSVKHVLEHKISVFQSKIKEGPYYIIVLFVTDYYIEKHSFE